MPSQPPPPPTHYSSSLSPPPPHSAASSSSSSTITTTTIHPILTPAQMAADASPSSAKEDPDRSLPPSASPPQSTPSTGNPNSNSSPNRSPKSDPAATDLSTPPPPGLPNLPPSLALPLPPPRCTTSASSRRLPPPCWTHEETLALIESYREKWYALRRGNLRASHWQEVADGVGRRCQHLIVSSATNPKTSVQCRHKVEKLRKRYRAERQRALRANPVNPPAPSWVYFSKMDAMELGTSSVASSLVPSTGTRLKAVPPSYSSDASSPDDDDDEEDEADDYRNDGAGNPNNTRAFHGLMLKANGGGSGGGGPMGGLKFTFPKAVRSERANLPNANPRSNPNNGYFRGFPGGSRLPLVEEMRKRMENRRKKERVGDLVGEMVTAVKMLGDGFMRMEEMKMEMAREMEKLRMEMEIKRTKMILESQRQIVDTFVRGFCGKKRAKIALES